MNIQIIGFVGAARMVVTLAMKTMIPRRAVGVISSIFQVAVALLAGITPMLIQHSILLPMKAYVYARRFLFRKSQAAAEMFIVSSGRLRLSEIAVEVLPGGVVGELGFLAPHANARVCRGRRDPQC